MLPDPAELPAMAARIYHRARSAADRAVRAGRIGHAAAASRLRLWLAMAAHGGADLPELTRPFECFAWHGAGEPPLTRRLASHEIAERAEWLPILVEARSAALARYEAEPSDENCAAARDLLHFANAVAFTGHPAVPAFLPTHAASRPTGGMEASSEAGPTLARSGSSAAGGQHERTTA